MYCVINFKYRLLSDPCLLNSLLLLPLLFFSSEGTKDTNFISATYI